MHIRKHGSWKAVPDLASPIHGGRRPARLLRLARRLQAWALQWRRTLAAEAELASMSDHMLADIGVSRCEVARVARRGRCE